jgi:hypothetical protein
VNRNIVDLLVALVGVFFVFFIAFALVENFIVNLTSQGGFVNVSDILAVTAILVSIISVSLTFGWNIWIHSRTSDIYQPVASVDFKWLPPYTMEGQETIVSIKNVGKRNLRPAEVYYQCSWESDKTELDLGKFAEYLAPEETYDFSIRIEPPIEPKVYSVNFHITEKDSGLTWRARRMFYIPTPDEMIAGKQ